MGLGILSIASYDVGAPEGLFHEQFYPALPTPAVTPEFPLFKRKPNKIQYYTHYNKRLRKQNSIFKP